jgi:hypothetical protein
MKQEELLKFLSNQSMEFEQLVVENQIKVRKKKVKEKNNKLSKKIKRNFQ